MSKEGQNCSFSVFYNKVSYANRSRVCVNRYDHWAVAWSETVGIRTRPVSDKKSILVLRLWSCLHHWYLGVKKFCPVCESENASKAWCTLQRVDLDLVLVTMENSVAVRPAFWARSAADLGTHHFPYSRRSRSDGTGILGRLTPGLGPSSPAFQGHSRSSKITTVRSGTGLRYRPIVTVPARLNSFRRLCVNV